MWGGGGGGGVSAPPPAVCRTTEPSLEPKPAFDSSGRELSEYIAKIYINDTDSVTGRVKGHIFTVTAEFAGQSGRIRLKRRHNCLNQIEMIDMDRVWGTSEYPPQPFVTLYQINVISRIRSKRSNLKF